MSEEMMTAMRQAISDVMNKMFFLPVQICEKKASLREWFSGKTPAIGAIVGFTGPLPGFSYLLIPAEIAREITANFLGISEKTANTKQEKDTVKEALNMITGLTLSQFDKKGAFKIGIPELIDENKMTAGLFDDFNKGAIFIETERSRMAGGIVMNQVDRL